VSYDNTAPAVWRRLSSVSELSAVSEKWHFLNQLCGGVLFCSPQWQLHWVSCFWQADWQLETWICTSGDNLVAVLPCYTQPAGSNKKRLMFPLGQGEAEECEVASEFVDLLIAPGWLQLLPELARLLRATGRVRLKWRAVNTGANILKLVNAMGYPVIQASGYRYLYRTDYDLHLTSQLNRKWQKISRYENQQRAQFCWLNNQQASDIWPELKRLHQQRWSRRGKPGAFIADVFNQFHQTFIMQQPDAFAMAVLKIDGDFAAIHYYLKSNDYLHFYQAGWAEKFSALSPSAMLHLWAARQMNNLAYDFMLGAVRSYKQDLCNQKQLCYQLDVYADVVSYALAILRKLKRQAGRLKWLS